MTGFLLFGGFLGDALGRRRILLVGTAVAVGANLACTLAPGPGWFAAFRGLEGFGSALAFPMTLALIQGSFDRRGSVLALLVYTLVTALGAVASISALAFTALWDWRATLILPICTGAVGLWLGWRYVPETRRSTGADLHSGLVITGWSLVLLALTLGVLTWRQQANWDNPVTIIALVIGGLGGIVLAVSRRSGAHDPHERRLNWHERHALTIMLLAAVVVNLGMSGYLIAGGLALMGFALVLTAALVGPSLPYWPLMIPMVVFGFAFLIAQTAWNNAFLRVIPSSLVGASAGTSKAAAQVGTWLGSALLAMIVLQNGHADFASRLAGFGLSPDAIARATSAVDTVLRADPAPSQSIAPGTLLEGALLGTYYESYTVGVSSALVWAAGICICMAVIGWIVFRSPAPYHPDMGKQ